MEVFCDAAPNPTISNTQPRIRFRTTQISPFRKAPPPPPPSFEKEESETEIEESDTDDESSDSDSEIERLLKIYSDEEEEINQERKERKERKEAIDKEFHGDFLQKFQSLRQSGFHEARIQKHWGITCGGCKKENLSGVRYKCVKCEDFDLCSTCFEQRATKHPKHTFVEISDPKLIVFQKGSSLYFPIHEHVSCSNCKTESIAGPRWKCVSCLDYDLCWKCHGKFHTKHNFHKMPTGSAWLKFL